jgi:PAS domain S-box-containing protein
METLENQVMQPAEDDHKGWEHSSLADTSYKILVNGITDYAIYMIDSRGHVVTWNPGAQRFKGYTADEIIGENFARFYREDDRNDGLPERALRTAALEGKFEAEGWRVRKDGSTFWAHVVIDPVHDKSGELIGFAKITRDLTERNESQRKLELAREALFQSQKMDAIGQLTGGVAHDFNNLLMATLSSLELLRRRVKDDPKALRLLENAVKGAERGATLTQRMLAFARRQDLKPVRVELPALVHGMADLIRRSLGPSIAVEMRFPLNLTAVTADTNQIEMALLNLVVNARDALPEIGSITISATEQTVVDGAANGLAPGRYVSLTVTDNGEGMDADTLARATEPFFTTKGVGKGTGLGLPMVHGLAEQSGGRFFIESTPGKGTTASLWLPASDVPAEVPAETVPGPDPVVRPLTILVVEDDGLILMNAVALLEDLGHTVLEAASGEAALALFRSEPAIDLVITDQAMPNMTGLQLMELARAERPEVPFIIATGYGELPQNTGTVLRLAKPYSQSDLAAALAEAMAATSVA